MRVLKNVALAAAIAVSVGFLSACADQAPPKTTTIEYSTTGPRYVRCAAPIDQQHRDHESISGWHRDDEHHTRLFECGNETSTGNGSIVSTRQDDASYHRPSSKLGSNGASPERNNHFYELRKRGHRAKQNYTICRWFGPEADYNTWNENADGPSETTTTTNSY
jgi:hypothetical protein